MKSVYKAGLLIVVLSVIVPILFFICLVLFGFWHDSWSGYNASVSVSDGFCTIAVTNVFGDIMPYHEFDEYMTTTPSDVRTFLQTAENDESVLGALIRIDSPGGTPAASEAIADMLKMSTLPTVALIGEYGTSGGYLVASAADVIVASPFSDVGSIGVTMSYVSNVGQNEKEGRTYVPLTSAKFKDYGSADKELTVEERQLIERDLAIYHQEFVQQVASNRKLSVEEVRVLADGSSLPASLAKEAKLVDVVGSLEDVKIAFSELLSIPVEEVILCE